jgi:3D-(3,5/4)-trihydroxycyclohexane-1,2-dione acylhydrolase (decyclizing)
VTLALCQDVQTEAFDFPLSFFEEKLWLPRRPEPDQMELGAALALIKAARKPLVVAGGGVLYSAAEQRLLAFCETHRVPCAETQAGKSSLPAAHPLNLGAIGVTGTGAANAMAREADLVLAIGTRLQDFTTASWTLFENPAARIIGLNVAAFDAGKHRAQPLVCDADVGLERLAQGLEGPQTPVIQVTRPPPQGFLARQTRKLARALVPELDLVLHVHHHDRVGHQVEQPRLFQE